MMEKPKAMKKPTIPRVWGLGMSGRTDTNATRLLGEGGLRDAAERGREAEDGE